MLFRIVEDEMPPLPEVSEELADFLRMCFVKDPKLRPSADVLFEHPWLRMLNPELVRREAPRPCAVHDTYTIAWNAAHLGCCEIAALTRLQQVLRPQDSVPFLRRVSMDLRRVDSARFFAPEGDSSDSVNVQSNLPDPSASTTDLPRRGMRHSFASSGRREGSVDGVERPHAFIKTTFAKGERERGGTSEAIDTLVC